MDTFLVMVYLSSTVTLFVAYGKRLEMRVRELGYSASQIAKGIKGMIMER